MPNTYIKLIQSFPIELQVRVLEYSITHIPYAWIEFIDVILFVNPKTKLKLTRLEPGGTIQWSLKLCITNTIDRTFYVSNQSLFEPLDIFKKFECFDELNINSLVDWQWSVDGDRNIFKELIGLNPLRVNLIDNSIPRTRSDFWKALREISSSSSPSQTTTYYPSFLIEKITSLSLTIGLVTELLIHLHHFKSLTVVIVRLSELFDDNAHLPSLELLAVSVSKMHLRFPDNFRTFSLQLWNFLTSNHHVTFDSIKLYSCLDMDSYSAEEKDQKLSMFLSKLINLPNERINSVMYHGAESVVGLLFQLKHLEYLTILEGSSLSNLKIHPVNSTLKHLTISDPFLCKNVDFTSLNKLNRISIESGPNNQPNFKGMDSKSFNSLPYKVKKIRLDRVDHNSDLHSFKVSKYLRELSCQTYNLIYFDFSNLSHLHTLELKLEEKIPRDDDIIWDSLPTSVEKLRIVLENEYYDPASICLIGLNITKILSPVHLDLNLNFRVVYVNCTNHSKYEKIIQDSQDSDYDEDDPLYYVSLKISKTDSIVNFLMNNDDYQWVVVPNELIRKITFSSKEAVKRKSSDGYTIFEFA